MRRTGAVLASVAVVVLGVPISVAVPAAATAGCSVSALPVPPSSANGGSAETILEPGTYLGWTDAPYVGELWQDGAVSSLPIIPDEVNSGGTVVGSVGSRAARLQLGGTVQYGSTNPSFMNDVNEAGDAVGTRSTPGVWPPYWYEALYWQHGTTTATALPGPQYNHALAIDDLGYKIGWAETYQGERRYLVWGADNTIVRQFGPFAAGETKIAPQDIDDGVVVADRYPPTGAKDIVLVDVVTGAITPLPASGGLNAIAISNGSVVATDVDFATFVLWHNGVRHVLPELPDRSTRDVADLEVFGATAYLSGFSYPATTGWFETPTVWQCG